MTDQLTWKPTAETVHMLDFAMAQIKSVPYQVPSRWLFYRCLQAGLYRDKTSINKFDYATSRARKSFYGEWRPDTLIDSIRDTYYKGEKTATFALEFDALQEQSCIVQCWFEARAMYRQFEHYTDCYRVSLVPFGGDVSIAIKWELAKKIEELERKYHKPIIVLYYGDYDRKGFKILEAALKDIKAWSKVSFYVERVGLTLEQVKEFQLPENPDHPSAYQWEALTDQQAKRLILDSLAKYLKPIPEGFLSSEDNLRQKCIAAMRGILDEHDFWNGDS
jgi:hypothetical protein